MKTVMKHVEISPEQLPKLRDMYANKLTELNAHSELTVILDQVIEIISPSQMSLTLDVDVICLYLKVQDVMMLFSIEDCTRHLQVYEDEGQLRRGYLTVQAELVTVATALDLPVLSDLVRNVIRNHSLTDVMSPMLIGRNLETYQLFIKMADNLHIDFALLHDPVYTSISSTAVN